MPSPTIDGPATLILLIDPPARPDLRGTYVAPGACNFDPDRVWLLTRFSTVCEGTRCGAHSMAQGQPVGEPDQGSRSTAAGRVRVVDVEGTRGEPGQVAVEPLGGLRKGRSWAKPVAIAHHGH
jgi:hypothetical protein